MKQINITRFAWNTVKSYQYIKIQDTTWANKNAVLRLEYNIHKKVACQIFKL